MPTYLQIFAKAWNITWRNPRLWILGILTALLGRVAFAGGGAVWNGLRQGGLFDTSLKDLWQIILSSPVPFVSTQLLLLLIVIVIILIGWIATIALASLIYEIVQAGAGKTTAWPELILIGLKRSWYIIFLYVIIGLIFWVQVIPFGLLIIDNVIITSLVFVFAFLISLPLMAVIFLLFKYAVCSAVLKNHGLMDAIKQAADVFKQSWLMTIEVALILFVLFWGISFLLGFITTLSFIGALTFQDSIWIPITAVTIFGTIDFFINVLLTIFSWATWITVFEIISNPKFTAKSLLQRIFSR